MPRRTTAHGTNSAAHAEADWTVTSPTHASAARIPCVWMGTVFTAGDATDVPDRLSANELDSVFFHRLFDEVNFAVTSSDDVLSMFTTQLFLCHVPADGLQLHKVVLGLIVVVLEFNQRIEILVLRLRHQLGYLFLDVSF